ncbi:hypothetical protein EOL70_14565 [Leucothrix sargassi]|nr:hypothetical protein EOL70_14565 [Leucothrix sargassi]
MSVSDAGTDAVKTKTWSYVDTGATRDLRLDFMRGIVIPLLFASHFEYFSALMYIGWERIGIVSTAEIFVILAGVVVGMVFGKKLRNEGLAAAMPALMDRSIKLYMTNVVLILIIAAMRYIPELDSTIITTYHSPYSGKTYPLFPSMDSGIFNLLHQTLLLRIGPHQFQIVGMYVVMFILVTPFVFFMLSCKRVGMLLGLSWVIYLINFGAPEPNPGSPAYRPTQAQFEYAFPIYAWQLIYVHGIVAGYYKKEVVAFFTNKALGKALLYLSFILTAAFIFLTWHNPLDEFESVRLRFLSTDTFHWLNGNYFQKYKLGPGRLLNVAVVLITMYALLTRFWVPISKALGWFFIPLGQASLYVFYVHIFFLLILANTPLPEMNDFWINTAIHAGLLISIWIMVRTRFLFKIIPN